MLHSPHLVLHIPYCCYTTPFAVMHPVLLLHNPFRCYTNTFAVSQSVLLLHNPRFSKLLICVSCQNAELTITATATTLSTAVWQGRCAPTSDACATAGWRCPWEPSVVGPNSKHWFTTYFLQPLPYLRYSYAIGSRKLSANKQFFVGAQTVISLLQTTQMILDVCL